MMATYTCSRCGIIYEPGPDNMIERTIVRTQRYTSTIAGEDIYWLCPKCREKFIEAANNFVYGNRKENEMTVFKCDRCGRKGYDLYRISLNEFYRYDGRYQPYGATYSAINLCQACFDELKGFLNAYGKEVLHDGHCRDERSTKNDSK